MSDLKYKGYRATVELCADDELLVGKVADIEALIMFSAENVADLKSEFHAAIEAYLAECVSQAIAPEKAYKGSFNVRIGTEEHRRAARLATQWGISLNEFIRVAVNQVMDRHAVPAAKVVAEAAFEHGYPYPAQTGKSQLQHTQPYRQH